MGGPSRMQAPEERSGHLFFSILDISLTGEIESGKQFFEYPLSFLAI